MNETTPITTTETELARAFEAWERATRSDPAAKTYWTPAELQRMTPEALGAQRARNLVEFLKGGR